MSTAAAPLPPAVRRALVALVLALYLGDRIGLPVGSAAIGFSLPLAYGLLLVLHLHRWLEVDTRGLLLFVGLALVACSSFLLNQNLGTGSGPSATSMLLLLALYLPFVFRLPAHAARPQHWMWLMGVLADVLLFIAACGIVQYGAQFVFRAPWLFDASQLVPESFRSQGYNTAIPVGGALKANGFFLREPSGFSAAMAIGLLLELLLFRRPLRGACFAAGLLLSYSGTGILALAIGLLVPLRARVLAWLGACIVLVVAFSLMAGDPLNLLFTIGRVQEFQYPGSSAYQRYVAPLRMVDDNLVVRDWSLWLGHGPGMVLKISGQYDAHDPTWAKLLFEYGLAGFLACLALVLTRLAVPVAPLPLRAVLFAMWLLMGGHLLIPENVLLLLAVLGIWPRACMPAGQVPLSPLARPGRHAGPGPSRPAPAATTP